METESTPSSARNEVGMAFSTKVRLKRAASALMLPLASAKLTAEPPRLISVMVCGAEATGAGAVEAAAVLDAPGGSAAGAGALSSDLMLLVRAMVPGVSCETLMLIPERSSLSG